MPSPESLNLSTPLTQFASKYENSKMIAPLVSPEIKVSAVAGSFTKRSRADVNRTDMDDLFGADGRANELLYSVSTDTFQLVPRALVAFVSGAHSSVVTSGLSPEEEAIAQVMQAIKLSHEKRVATVMTTTTSYTSANRRTAGVSSKPQVATKWSDWSAGDPLGDLKSAIRALPSAGDEFDRVLWISDVVFDALVSHPQILALKGTTSGVASEEELVSFLRGLDRVAISETTYNSANEGQTASYSRIWSETACGVVLVPKSNPSTEASIFAASFQHTDGFRVREERDGLRGYGGSIGYVVEHYTQPAKVIQDDCGVIISGCL